jgi:DNA-binding MarR family transcriptional regulator
VARLRERGVLETTPDPTDGRRTKVQVARPAMRAIARRARRPSNDTITTAVADADAARWVTAMLDELAELLLTPGQATQRSTAAR